MTDLSNQFEPQQPSVQDDLSWLNIPEPTEQEAPQIDQNQYQAFLQWQQSQQPQTAPVTQKQEAPSFENDENYSAFNNQISQYLGVGVDDLREAMGFISEMRRERQLQPLRSEWGDDFDSRFGAAKELYNRLPPQQQQIYNNVDGLKFLAAKAASMAQQQPPGGQVPTFDRGRSSTPGTTGRFKFSQSELAGMDDQTYRSRQAEIAAAYSQGLVDFNS